MLDGDSFRDNTLDSVRVRTTLQVAEEKTKSVCILSLREMSPLEKVRPGIRPNFLSQRIDANEPEKKPSTAANATKRQKSSGV